MIGKMIICCLLFSLNAAAQKQDIDSVSTQGSKLSLMDKLRQVQQYLDDKAKKKVDPHYIEVPEKPQDEQKVQEPTPENPAVEHLTEAVVEPTSEVQAPEET